MIAKESSSESLHPSSYGRSPAAQLRREAARRLGYRLENLDPETGYLQALTDGQRRRVFVAGLSPLNDAGAMRLTGDKFFAGEVLREAGFRVPAVARCLRDGTFERSSYPRQEGLEPARRFASEHGFPLVVKPNRGSRARDVAVVGHAGELEAAVHRVWQNDYLALVQECIIGCDLRLDFLGGEFLLGYRRQPVVLEGDGRSSIGELLQAWDETFSGPDFERRLQADPFWQERVEEQGLGLASVLPPGQEIPLTGAILNLARFCVARLVEELPSQWLEFGLAVGRALHLRHFGIDLRVPEEIADLSGDPRQGAILEVNSSPGLGQIFLRGAGKPVVAAEMRVLQAILDTAEALEPVPSR